VSAPAFAQTTAPAPAAEAPSPARIAAARDMLQAAIIDTGALNSATIQSFTLLAPQMRTKAQSAPYYAGLTAAHQQAVSGYFDTVGPIASDMVAQTAPAALDAQAPTLAAVFTEAEAHDIATFLRTTEGRSIFL